MVSKLKRLLKNPVLRCTVVGIGMTIKLGWPIYAHCPSPENMSIQKDKTYQNNYFENIKYDTINLKRLY